MTDYLYDGLSLNDGLYSIEDFALVNPAGYYLGAGGTRFDAGGTEQNLEEPD